MAGRRTTRTKAIVLDRTKLGEQDLILTMLGESGEQVRAVAKGARKPGGRLASRSELFFEGDYLVAQGRSLGIVTEAQTVDAHPALRGDYARVSAACAVCEVARLTCSEGAQDRWLYPACSRALSACEEAQGQPALDVAVAAYAMKAMAHGGWMPELDACLACGDRAVAYFSSAAGGVLCASCAHEVPGAEEVGAAQVAWLRALIGARFDDLLASPPDAETAAWLLGVAHSWAATHLECRLRALEFLLGG